MKRSAARRTLTAVTAVLVMGVLLAPSASARAVRTSGTGQSFQVSWLEIDKTDALGLPGNVHVGYLGGYNDPWGTYWWGVVTDFECDEGEVWWGGGGHGSPTEELVEDAAIAAAGAVAEAIDDVIDSGAKSIDADLVVANVKSELSSEVPAEIEEEAPPACDWVQDRFLDGGPNATFTVNMSTKTLRVTGNLLVHGGHGEHGEPGPVLGQPPIDMTITGGKIDQWKNSYVNWGKGYKYSYSSEGANYYGGKVTGRIGGMGFADDADDESWGGFGSYTYKTVERIRN